MADAGRQRPHLLHRAKAEADASVEIDPALGVGHWMCAVVALYQRDFDISAERFFEAEALALTPPTFCSSMPMRSPISAMPKPRGKSFSKPST